MKQDFRVSSEESHESITAPVTEEVKLDPPQDKNDIDIHKDKQTLSYIL